MADIVTMPKLGFDMAEGTLLRWVKKEGDKVEKGELLAEIETDKATVEVESQYSGVVLKHLVTEGTPVPVSNPIAAIGAEGEKYEGAAAQAVAPKTEEKSVNQEPSVNQKQAIIGLNDKQIKTDDKPIPGADADGRLPDGVRASPLARKIAQERGVNLKSVRGSGPLGRITKRDVEGAKAGGSGLSLPGLQLADLGPAPADKRVPLTRLRSAIGRRMVQSRQEIPHFYVTHEYDVDRLLEARAQANAALEGSGEKLSVNDFIIKAAALTLRQYPNLNAKLDGDAIVQLGQVNIGVAVAVEGGLLVVVCRDADRKPLRQISQEVREMAGRVREGKVSTEDIEGSTFSISNLGMYDVHSFTAIVNPPEAAILAVGAAQEVPVIKNGQIVMGNRMRITISIDHRISDGAEGAQYLQALAAYIENPIALLM
ncbi:MAG: 2-oxo acid dehydrogenase subunit E2 [Anaerolineales bacterium]|jgi:pyruvate dehydrogenase E2 component (dihydrolipoamide acetyltransferase)|nr:2-oxo acid dehydrogenase subunit E2 [Anaerolineales bacterium]MCW5888303.1 2-oxo acid dehydrogenase subunit E2 [Anaerolineales bacterium]